MRRRAKRQGPPEREGGRAVVLIVLVLALMFGGGYVAAYAGADGKLPDGTTVAGVDVGGRDPQAAARALERGLAPRLQQAITLSVGDQRFQVTPAEAGISVDYTASVEQALGSRSWGPSHLWDYYTGGGAHAPVVTVDRVTMDSLLNQLDQKAGQPARDGGISLADGTLQVTQPRNGAQIQHGQATQAIVAAWTQNVEDVTLPLLFTPPDIDSNDLNQAIQNLANPALSGPVILKFARSRVSLSPHDYAPMLTITPKNGVLALNVVRTDLALLVDPTAHDTTPVDASVGLVDGVPTLVKAQPGQTYGPGDVARAFLQGVDAAGTARKVTVTGQPTPATFTNSDARALGVKELVSTYSVKLPARPGQNIAADAAELSGVLLRPGDTFSFDSRVADTSGAASRLATATWNAAFLAGLTDVERTAPTTFADGLPAGRDVALGPGLDLQVRNDTKHGVLFSAGISGGQVTVNAFSTKEWDVTAATGAPYSLVPRTTVTDTTPTCVAAPGADGFSIDLTRSYSHAGSPVIDHTDTVTTTYAPVNAVVCAAPPPAVPPPDAPPA